MGTSPLDGDHSPRDVAGQRAALARQRQLKVTPGINPIAYIIDDDDDFRHSIILLLETAGWSPRGFPSVTAFLEVQRSLEAGPLLLDLRMPRVGGLDLLESGLLDAEKFATIVITGHGEIESAVRSLKAGAVDFLEKPFSAEDIVQAVETASSFIAADSVRREANQQANELVSRLTKRELHILQGMIGGMPYKVVAHRLDISVRTVEMHRENVLRKFNIRSNAEAVRIGVLANVQPLEVISQR